MRLKIGDLSRPDIQELLQEHLSDMAKHSPVDSVHALDVDALSTPDVTFWSVWRLDALAGCGALLELNATQGEVKSMRTKQSHQKRGVAAFMLTHIIDEARQRGYQRLNLETGSMAFFEPARRLYSRFGFVYCEPFADYEQDIHSVYMTLKF